MQTRHLRAVLLSLCLIGLVGAVFQADVRPAGAADLGERRTTRFGPVLEWDLDNRSWSGNAYDVQARATFTHERGETITTPMFYAGGTSNRWTFRFTAARPESSCRPLDRSAVPWFHGMQTS